MDLAAWRAHELRLLHHRRRPEHQARGGGGPGHAGAPPEQHAGCACVQWPHLPHFGANSSRPCVRSIAQKQHPTLPPPALLPRCTTRASPPPTACLACSTPWARWPSPLEVRPAPAACLQTTTPSWRRAPRSRRHRGCLMLDACADAPPVRHPACLPAPGAGQAVLPEIQATLARPPATVQTMMKARALRGWRTPWLALLFASAWLCMRQLRPMHPTTSPTHAHPPQPPTPLHLRAGRGNILRDCHPRLLWGRHHRLCSIWGSRQLRCYIGSHSWRLPCYSDGRPRAPAPLRCSPQGACPAALPSSCSQTCF